MAVQGDIFLNFLANDVKSFSNIAGNSAVKLQRSFQYQLAGEADGLWLDSMALAAGTLTFSLEALPRVNQPALDLSGLEVTWLWIFNRVGNASMNFAPAAVNGYTFASATDGIDIGGGGLDIKHEPAGYGVVGTTLSDITVTGTGTQVFEMAIIARDLS